MIKPTNIFNSTPNFAQQQQQTGFGSPAPATSNIFGTQQQKPFSFSGPTTSTTGFGGGSIFGAQTTTTPSTGFSNFNSPSLSLPTSTSGGFSGFNNLGNAGLGAGSTGFSFTGGNSFQGFQTQVQGTSIPFNAITGTDTMMKNGVAAAINTRHQCITCMKEYEQKCLEELRLEDYQLGRKGSAQQQNTLFGSTQAQPTGLFSPLAPATNTTTAFGQQRPAAFGTNTTQQSSGGLFGNMNQPKPNFFGTTPASTGFGATSSAGGFSFTSTQPQTSLFGQTTPATSTGGIGTTSGFGFAQPIQQQGVGVFGQKPALTAPAATSAPFGFGTQTNAAMIKPTTSIFNSTPNFAQQQPGFGSPAPATSNIFGAQQQKPFSFSGPTTSNTGFGGGSIFGAQTTTTASTGLPNFGSPSLSLPTSNTGFPGFNLGNTSLGAGSSGFSFTGGNTFQPGGMQQQQQQLIPPTGPVPFATTPYKDSPLFYNLITNRNLDTMTKPTNPVAQRAVKEASRRRSSTALGSFGPATSLKQFTYPVSKAPVYNKPNTLFDGFEDDDHGPVIDILSPKTSVKKLSLKTVRNVQRSSLPSTWSFSLNDSMPGSSHSVSLNDTYQSCPTEIHSAPDSPSPVNNNGDFEERRDEDVYTNAYDTSNGGSFYEAGDSIEPGMEGIRRLRTDDHFPPPSPRNGIKKIQVHEFDAENYTPHSQQELEEIVKGKELKKSGVVCSLQGYYTQPAVPELDLYTDDDGKCFIRGFCVGRYNYGQVRFMEAVNVAGLNIDEIVKFRHKEIVVYPEEMESPPVGQGLNVRAQVRLERIWPVNKISREPVTNPAQIRALKYEDLLRKSCERMDATFISYDVETGVWTFLVKHFSKYSCVPEEDEDDPEFAPPAPKLAMTGLGGVSSAQLKKRLPTPKQKQPIIAEGNRKSHGLYSDLTDEFPPVIISNLNSELKLDGGVQRKYKSFLPTTPMHDDEADGSDFVVMNEDTEQSILVAPRSLLRNIFFPIDSNSSLSCDEEYGKGRMMMVESRDTSGFYESESENIRTLTEESRMDRDHTLQENQMDTSVALFRLDEPIISLTSSQIQIWQYHERQEIPRKPVLEPLNLFRKLLTASTSVSLPPRHARATFASKSHFIQILNNAQPSPYVRFNGQVTLNRIESELKQMDHGSVAEYRHILISQLEAYFKNSILSYDDSYIIDSEMSSTLISGHAEIIHTILDSSPNLPLHHTSILREEIQVWNLIEILWPNNQHNSIKNQTMEMNQRARLSRWLNQNAAMLFSELFVAADNSVKGLLLKGMKYEASLKAFKDKNPVLGLALAQNNPNSQRHVSAQLDLWDKEGVLEFIDMELIELYSLCAGYPVWNSVDFERMTSAEWLQHFATFVWYLSPTHLPIQGVVEFYQATIRNSWGQENCDGEFCAPHPESSSQNLANLCIHLLKMFSCVGYPVSKLLSPNSHCTDHFNYKISFFLMNALRVIGIMIDPGLLESITTGFATQLEGLGMWEYTVFVLKFLPPSEPRMVAIRRILERNLTLALKNLPAGEYDKKLQFLMRIGLTIKDITDALIH